MCKVRVQKKNSLDTFRCIGIWAEKSKASTLWNNFDEKKEIYSHNIRYELEIKTYPFFFALKQVNSTSSLNAR